MKPTKMKINHSKKEKIEKKLIPQEDNNSNVNILRLKKREAERMVLKPIRNTSYSVRKKKGG